MWIKNGFGKEFGIPLDVADPAEYVGGNADDDLRRLKELLKKKKL